MPTGFWRTTGSTDTALNLYGFEGVVNPKKELLNGLRCKMDSSPSFANFNSLNADRVLASHRHYQYYGRPTNYRCLWRYYRKVRRIWKTWLNRRTRGKTLNWERYARLLCCHPLLLPRITRAWVS